MNTIVVEICMGSSCFARGNAKTLALLEDYINEHNLTDRVELVGHLCLGSCAQGPNIRIGSTSYSSVQPQEVISFLEQALEEVL